MGVSIESSRTVLRGINPEVLNPEHFRCHSYYILAALPGKKQIENRFCYTNKLLKAYCHEKK